MRTGLTVVGLVAALAAVGVTNLDRGDGGAAADVSARLASVPLSLGAWAGRDTPIDPNQLRVAEAEAYLSRTYADAKTGATVAVLVLYGRSGPLGAHTPQVCYGAAGFKQVSDEVARPVGTSDGGPAENLWSARFETPGVPPQVLRVTWGWGDGSRWEAADDPRVRFATAGRIFKLYASRPAPVGDRPDPADGFLGLFLTELRDRLTAPPTDASKGMTP